MKINRLHLPGLIVFMPRVLMDERGYFFESYHQTIFEKVVGFTPNFVQDNQSRSLKHFLRGLHYQVPPYEQGKLVRVVRGEIFDVVLDLRKKSHTFGRWTGMKLSEQNKYQLWIPPGFAHGFVAISPVADVTYKVTNFYHQKSERCILWNDPEINISWDGLYDEIKVSEKDAEGVFMEDADYFEDY